jgi:hypothetical protein
VETETVKQTASVPNEDTVEAIAEEVNHHWCSYFWNQQRY